MVGLRIPPLAPFAGFLSFKGTFGARSVKPSSSRARSVPDVSNRHLACGEVDKESRPAHHLVSAFM